LLSLKRKEMPKVVLKVNYLQLQGMLKRQGQHLKYKQNSTKENKKYKNK
jgi:hypothetical protein